MSWRDRDYAREGSGRFSDNPLMWLLTGRVRLFHIWDVTVYAHASLIIIVALVLLSGLLGGGIFGGLSGSLLFIGTLLLIVILHEFGHVWGARATGGHADEVLLTPLGGLALAQPAKGWYSHTITIICGPAVNVLICLVCAAILGVGFGYVPLGPFDVGSVFGAAVSPIGRVVYYVYAVSYFLLLFNLLPIWPLDGGQLLQGLLWWKVGWYKATLWATTIGLVGAVLLALYALAGGGGGRWLMFFIAISCGLSCFQLRRQLVAAGPWAFQEQDEPDWMSSVNMDPDAEEKVGLRERIRRRREEARAQREAEAVAKLEAQVDAVLAKISRTGIGSLTPGEKRILDQAREAKSRR